jgi:hypothetical protein
MQNWLLVHTKESLEKKPIVETDVDTDVETDVEMDVEMDEDVKAEFCSDG